ncbi:DegV family protein [Lachnospiraceae bacterium C1.1]|nr:DegV family protein [Lachnospiraceae bacterium C1.1]
MKFKYVADSCCEFPDFFEDDHDCVRVPLTINVGKTVFIDDASLNMNKFLESIDEYPKCPKSACPSPELYMKAFEGDADVIFVATLSAELSGSYQSARLAATIYEEEHPGKKIHVFNSESASSGEAQALMKAAEYADMGLSPDEIISKTEDFIHNNMQTFFVLENMEVLRKNGRLSRMKTLVAQALNIKPVCLGVHGVIEQAVLARGMAKALDKMVELSLAKIKDTKDRTLFITHVNCRERAEKVMARYISKAEFARTVILNTAGISSLYAGRGGIIVTF